MAKSRLDVKITQTGLVQTRSQAESYIKLGKVRVGGIIITKPGYLVADNEKLSIAGDQQYVSRAGLKLASVAGKFGLDFVDTTVLDVGSSTGGFTDYALQNGAARVIAIDVGTDQLHPRLRKDERVESHEKTDIRSWIANLRGQRDQSRLKDLQSRISIVVIDVSFISLREILPHILHVVNRNSQVVAMVKPQFEAGRDQTNKGVIKNSKIRRDILKAFEDWVRSSYVIVDKADSDIAGARGNLERFYLLKPIQ